ncbi:MAG: hypothetical protein JSV08_06160 [Acidobacteriota bacterium]|nr:MAG: hypothetical protein JSV08_06160 [Acidobacteriota bacterium]
MGSCSEWDGLFEQYEAGGEAAPLVRHVRGCAECLGRAGEEASEIRLAALASRARLKEGYLDSVRMPWDLPAEAAPAPRRSIWLDGLRKAAAIALVVGAAWAGWWFYERSRTFKSTAGMAAPSAPSVLEELRTRYPLVRSGAAQMPYYTAELPDGTRMVCFYAADF